MQKILDDCSYPGLFQKYSGRNDPDWDIATTLLRRLNIDGDVKLYLKQCYYTLSQKDLLTVEQKNLTTEIEQIYATVSDWEPGPQAYLESLGKIIQDLSGEFSDQNNETLKLIQKELKENFEIFLQGVNELTLYKSAHDIFHELDMRWSGQARHVAMKSNKAEGLRQAMDFQKDLKTVFENATKFLTSIASIGGIIVEILKTILDVIKKFLPSFANIGMSNDAERNNFHQAAMEYDANISTTLLKLNNSICESAAKLNLSKLTEALQTYGEKIPENEGGLSKEDYLESVIWIEDKFSNSINNLVKLHDRWQKVSPNMNAIETGLSSDHGRHDMSAPILWPMTRTELEPLYQNYSAIEKRDQLLGYLPAMDASFANLANLSDEEFDRLKLQFTLCKGAAGQTFFDVDKNIVKECQALSKLEPGISEFIGAL